MRAFCLPPPLKSLELDPEKSVFVRSKSVALGVWGCCPCVCGSFSKSVSMSQAVVLCQRRQYGHWKSSVSSSAMKRTRIYELSLQRLRSRVDARLAGRIFISRTDCLGRGRRFHYWRFSINVCRSRCVLVVTMA